MHVRRYLLPLIAAVLACYPLYAALLLAADSTIGTHQLLNWVTFESKHALLRQILTDISASASVALPIVLIAALIGLHVWQRCSTPVKWGALGAITLLPALTFIGMGLTFLQAVLFATVVLLSTMTALLCSWVFGHAPH